MYFDRCKFFRLADQLPVAFGHKTRDGVAVFFIVKRDAFDDAIEGLEGQIGGDVHGSKYKSVFRIETLRVSGNP